MRRLLVVPGVAAALWLAAPARADTNSVTAEALFQQGRALLDAGRVSEACPKLAESHRLEPATGALIALAVCHETEGKLASAWAEFMEARGRARREGQAERETLATDRALALEDRLSVIKLQVAESTAKLGGLEVVLDGVVLGRSVWNASFAIDGGTHALEVRAPGHESFQTEFKVQREKDRVRVNVPELRALPPNEQQPHAGPPPKSATRSNRLGTLPWVGIGTAGAGLAAWGVGGYFLSSALRHRSDAEGECDGDQCSQAGVDARKDAVHDGNRATLFAIGGGVLVATGATLFFLGSGSSEEAPAVAAGAGVTPDGVSLAVRGAF